MTIRDFINVLTELNKDDYDFCVHVHRKGLEQGIPFNGIYIDDEEGQIILTNLPGFAGEDRGGNC